MYVVSPHVTCLKNTRVQTQVSDSASLSTLLKPHPFLCCAVSKVQLAHMGLDGVTCQCQPALPAFLSTPEPFLGFLPAGEQKRQHGAPRRGFFKLPSVVHKVAWLLGTPCCLTTGGGSGVPNCRELFPLHVALNSWQEPDTVGLPRWPFWPAAPGRMPWLVPGVGPTPDSCAVLFGKALADVVDLNCFLVRLSLRPGLPLSSPEHRLHY